MIEILNQIAQAGGGAGFVATGPVGAQLLAANMDINVLRPWVGKDRRSYIKQAFFNAKGELVEKSVPLNNTVATLRRDEWIAIDEAVVRATRDRLRAVSDIRGAGLEFRVNGMSKMVLETSTMTRVGRATLSMDPARMSEGDRPEFDTAYLPLPIAHYDFYFNLREILASRSGGAALDTVMVEEAGHSVAEEIEGLTVGTLSSYTFGGGTIYGLTNFPARITGSLTMPTNTDWSGQQLVDDILEMRQALSDDKKYGPYILYVSPNWARYLDADYSANKGINTVRTRLLEVEGVTDIRQLDSLTGYQILMVEMRATNLRMVVGMEITNLQWDSIGGMRQNFKTMALIVPQMRADGDGNSGIAHYTAT